MVNSHAYFAVDSNACWPCLMMPTALKAHRLTCGPEKTPWSWNQMIVCMFSVPIVCIFEMRGIMGKNWRGVFKCPDFVTVRMENLILGIEIVHLYLSHAALGSPTGPVCLALRNKQGS